MWCLFIRGSQDVEFCWTHPTLPLSCFMLCFYHKLGYSIPLSCWVHVHRLIPSRLRECEEVVEVAVGGCRGWHGHPDSVLRRIAEYRLTATTGSPPLLSDLYWVYVCWMEHEGPNYFVEIEVKDGGKELQNSTVRVSMWLHRCTHSDPVPPGMQGKRRVPDVRDSLRADVWPAKASDLYSPVCCQCVPMQNWICQVASWWMRAAQYMPTPRYEKFCSIYCLEFVLKPFIKQSVARSRYLEKTSARTVGYFFVYTYTCKNCCGRKETFVHLLKCDSHINRHAQYV